MADTPEQSQRARQSVEASTGSSALQSLLETAEGWVDDVKRFFGLGGQNGQALTEQGMRRTEGKQPEGLPNLHIDRSQIRREPDRPHEPGRAPFSGYTDPEKFFVPRERNFGLTVNGLIKPLRLPEDLWFRQNNLDSSLEEKFRGADSAEPRVRLPGNIRTIRPEEQKTVSDLLVNVERLNMSSALSAAGAAAGGLGSIIGGLHEGVKPPGTPGTPFGPGAPRSQDAPVNPGAPTDRGIPMIPGAPADRIPGGSDIRIAPNRTAPLTREQIQEYEAAIAQADRGVGGITPAIAGRQRRALVGHLDGLNTNLHQMHAEKSAALQRLPAERLERINQLELSASPPPEPPRLTQRGDFVDMTWPGARPVYQDQVEQAARAVFNELPQDLQTQTRQIRQRLAERAHTIEQFNWNSYVYAAPAITRLAYANALARSGQPERAERMREAAYRRVPELRADDAAKPTVH